MSEQQTGSENLREEWPRKLVFWRRLDWTCLLSHEGCWMMWSFCWHGDGGMDLLFFYVEYLSLLGLALR